jgi:hypothetical protein
MLNWAKGMSPSKAGGGVGPSEMKAISAPDGDHTGEWSALGLVVTCRAEPPSGATTKMSELPCRLEVKAIWGSASVSHRLSTTIVSVDSSTRGFTGYLL